MPDLILKAHDTYPPVVTALSQNGDLIDLSTATAVKILLKGSSVLVTGTCTKLTVVTPNVTTAIGSNVLTAVSSFTSVVVGGAITGTGIPSGARVGKFDSVAATITMVDSTGVAINAIASGTVVATINKGCVSYAWAAGDTAVIDTYQVEHEITWPGGPPTQIQTVPNSSYNSIQILADLENA